LAAAICSKANRARRKGADHARRRDLRDGAEGQERFRGNKGDRGQRKPAAGISRPAARTVDGACPLSATLRLQPAAAYAATQKRVWLRKKNAYLVLTRKSASHWDRQHVMANSTPITIKKYANRRLYNTSSSAYVTLADLAKMVKAGDDFIVYDAKTSEDITRSVLTQIIFEQEGIEGQSLLPTTFLRQLIRFYGDSMQAVLPSYLEFSIDRFSGEQQAMREAASRMFGPEAFSPGSFAAIQELTKKNFAAFSQALTLFSPFAGATTATESPPKKANSGDDIDDLRNQLSDMQKRLETLAKKG
jgi:polyhydroxyalkanoate synthesis repressor PhaR